VAPQRLKPVCRVSAYGTTEGVLYRAESTWRTVSR
jgi:hypothetical protein